MAAEVEPSSACIGPPCNSGSSNSMLTLGMLTGLSYVSGIDYYRGINERVAKKMPKGRIMPRNSEMVIVSLDCDTYVGLLTDRDEAGVSEYLCQGVRRLRAAGADLLVIASNTAHVCFPQVVREMPDFPVLHIADCVAAAVRTCGDLNVGLLGTEPTMRDGSWLKSRLAAGGVTVHVPEEPDHLKRCYDIICQELSFDIYRDESRDFLVSLIRDLARSGCSGGVILGCTELELLIRQDDVPEVRLFRSAELHIEAAAAIQSGEQQLQDYLPPKEGDTS